MLIKNDFLNHWKTKLLCRRLGDGAALRALLSLWCYCEQRRAWQFKLSPLELAGVCDFAPEQEEHLSNGEFTQRVGDLYLTLVELRLIIPLENGWWEVNGWGELNAAIIKKWPGRTLQTGEFYHPQGFVSRAIPTPIGQPIPPANDAAIAGAIGLDRIGMEGNGRDQGREGSTRTPARGAPASLEEAQTWAVSYSKGNSSGKEIAPSVVEKWWNHRQAVGWVNAREVPIVDWRADLTLWALNEPPPRPGSPMGNAANSPQKKEGAAPPGWDWKLLAQRVLDWSPVGSWEDQTARSRREIREAYAELTPEQQAAFALPAKTEGES